MSAQYDRPRQKKKINTVYLMLLSKNLSFPVGPGAFKGSRDNKWIFTRCVTFP